MGLRRMTKRIEAIHDSKLADFVGQCANVADRDVLLISHQSVPG